MSDFASNSRSRARSLSLPINTIRNRHSHVGDAITALNADGDLFGDPILRQKLEQIFRRFDRMAVEFHDHVADEQASGVGGTARLDVDDEQRLLTLFARALAL